jgi:hypothetical protein
MGCSATEQPACFRDPFLSKLVNRANLGVPMTSAEEAASAATQLRQSLDKINVVQRIDIGVDFDASHYVRVWVSHRTRELLANVPREVDGVVVRITPI